VNIRLRKLREDWDRNFRDTQLDEVLALTTSGGE